MKFMTALSFSEPHHYTELARTADVHGYDYLGLSDHVFFPERLESQYPYTGSGTPEFQHGTPWPDPWVAIGAMAAVTERVRFVTNVFQLPLRHPLLVAKAVGTAAYLSRDRVALGAGIGWMREEFDVLGADFRTRGRRCDEAIEILRRAWSGEMVGYQGAHYAFEPLVMQPAPEQPVPIFIGGISEPALRRAARLGDGWISALHSFEELRELIGRLRELRAEAGRAAEPFEVIVACSDAYGIDGYRRLEEIGATVVQTVPWRMYGGDPESLEDKAAGLERFANDVIAKLR
ncbi:MAG: LLM class F420-dependent oxidoreductase [Myxococcota bacterium]|nr:LLM class F420-dependent oxidoreductase [Myxococcota bacterium]